MKRYLRITAFALFAVLFAACARHKIIPDDKLAQIFHDAFLTNAYIGNGNVKTDSLRIYEPIFARYGYTTDDVHYTIGNFSKRKSARLGDIVERAIVRADEIAHYSAGKSSKCSKRAWGSREPHAQRQPVKEIPMNERFAQVASL